MQPVRQGSTFTCPASLDNARGRMQRNPDVYCLSFLKSVESYRLLIIPMAAAMVAQFCLLPQTSALAML
jgi:hypothetical protein